MKREKDPVARSVDELTDALEKREAEVKKSEAELRRVRDELEARMQERTRELVSANETLHDEIVARQHAQEKLRRSERELADFFENASIPIHWVGPDGIILRANQAELSLLGYAREEYVGHHISEFHVDQAVIGDILERLSAGEILHHYEARMRGKDGSIKDVLISSSVMWEEGRFIHTRCFTQDITNRKRTERRVATQHAVTRILAESQTLAEASVKILEAICECLEWEFGALWSLDKGVQELRCVEVWHHSSKDFRGFVTACRAARFSSGRGLPGRAWKSGEPAWIPDVVKDINFPRAPIAAKENLHGAFGFPIKFGPEFLGVMEFFSREIRQPDEAVLKMVEAIGAEVSQFIERLRAEEELQRRNNQLREAIEQSEIIQQELRAQNEELLEAQKAQALLAAIVESSDAAIISKGLDGVITSWNTGAERLFGYTAREAVGRPVTIIIPGDKHDEERMIVERLRRGERIEQYETVRVSRSGRLIDVSLTISPIRDSAGRIVGASKVARDITAQKKAQDALQQSENKLRRQAEELEQQLIASGRLVSLGEITASMAHEFNNPLGIVMGFAQDLLGDMDPSDPNYRALKIIDEETKRCQKIIQDLLQFARPRSADLCGTGVKDLVEKTVGLVANHLYKQKIEAVTEIKENLPSIHADPQQLEQVLVNLYLNAIDAMPVGGKLTVAADMKAGGGARPFVAVTVADTGYGIDEADLPKIFQPFFSARKKRGLGLGLAICDRIIRNHGGRLEVRSKVGQGTTFKIYLPVEHKRVERGGNDTESEEVPSDKASYDVT